MATTRSIELAAQADSLDEQGKEEQAAEVRHLASYGADAPDDEGTNQQAKPSGSVGQLASEVETLELEWVWNGWIPRQFVGLFAGDSGIGKSSVLRDLIKRLSLGEPLPDGQKSDPCGIVIISYEEPTETVLVPRLHRTGCDLTKVKILSTVKLRGNLGEPSERPFRVPEDLGILREAIAEVDAGIVFIDPLMSMTDKAIARNQTARELLGALQQVAHDCGCAIVIVAHLNKGRSKEMRQRMNSSKAFYDMPRFIMAAAQDVSNPAQATLWMDKHGLCDEMPTLTYERLSGGNVRFVSGHVEAAQADYIKEEEQRTDKLILGYLSAQHGTEVQARTVALAIRVTYDATRKQLQRMAADGLIERTERGWYRTLQPKVVVPVEKEDVAEEKTQIIGTSPNLLQLCLKQMRIHACWCPSQTRKHR